jgi:glycine/D-amino acid oxidase-like deaminating enzyme
LNSSSIPLPALATESKIDDNAVKQLQKTSKRLLGLPGDVDDLEVIKKGLCFRPVTNRGTPILGRIPDKVLGGISTKGSGDGGVFIAAGHGPWGISMSLGTGKVMAEIVMGLETSADVRGLEL